MVLAVTHRSGLTKKQRRLLKKTERHRQEAQHRQERDKLLAMISNLSNDDSNALHQTLGDAVAQKKWREGEALVDSGITTVLDYLGHATVLGAIQSLVLGTKGETDESEANLAAQYGG